MLDTGNNAVMHGMEEDKLFPVS